MPKTLAPPPQSDRLAGASRPGYVTAEEYLRFEETAETKHEWYDGEVREMPGVSIEHAMLVPRIEDEVSRALAGLPPIRLSYDLKIRIPDGPYCYCDGVWCAPPPVLEPPVRPGGRRAVLLNPTVIVEVLSDSTEGTDRGEKLDGHRTIPTLTDYLLFSQDGPEVAHHSRPPSGAWKSTAYRGRDATVALAAGGSPLSLGEIYAVLDGLAG